MNVHNASRTRRRAVAAAAFFIVLILIFPLPARPYSADLVPYRATPDQVLVIYNADWEQDSNSSSGQDSREIAEYYQTMHTDPQTGKKPYILGLNCRHSGRKHLNHWAIVEESSDNGNGVIFRGSSPPPAKGTWPRDSRKVEIWVNDPTADWETLRIRVKSVQSGEEKILTPATGILKFTGIPTTPGAEAAYPPLQEGTGRALRFDASTLFPGTVNVYLTLKNREGKTIRDLSLTYHDIRDFSFSPTGEDGISDEKDLEEDVLTPVRTFLENPANARSDGTLLKNHILYLVVVHGMPYAANAVSGIAHGATSNPGDHGSLASLEQRLQTIYYAWQKFRPPVISLYMTGGPDAENGVISYRITSAMRNSLTGSRWNPYMHPDTYSGRTPVFYNIAPLGERRKNIPADFFGYAVSRIDGADVETAKRLVDYAVYASSYLRPEMECASHGTENAAARKEAPSLTGNLARAERENLWGERELDALGFRVISPYDSGPPFLVRSDSRDKDDCRQEKPDWKRSGFYPGGMGREVISHNGWNMKNAPVWDYLDKGVTVTACGAPAYGGGPHITGATFWDNRIMTRYLFRGRDLGECFLLSTVYVNWSTSLVGDPLLHPDLKHTVIDRTPPHPADTHPAITFTASSGIATARIGLETVHDPEHPEVALIEAVAREKGGKEFTGTSLLYSRRPAVELTGLTTGAEYTFYLSLVDPYGNRTELPPLIATCTPTPAPASVSSGPSILKRLMNVIQGKEPLIPAGTP